MRHELLVFLLLFITSFCLAQRGFKTDLGLNPIESNGANHVVEHDKKFFCSGQYADTLAGAWNGFLAIYDFHGNLIKKHLLRNDTVFGINLNNYVNLTEEEYTIIGLSGNAAREIKYNFKEDSFYVSRVIDNRVTQTGVTALVIDQDTGQSYFCGGKFDPQTSITEYKIFSTLENDTLFYSQVDSTKTLRLANARLNYDGNLVVLASNRIGAGYTHLDSTFVTIFDHELEVLQTTLNTNKQAPAGVHKGMFIDSNNEIVCTHARKGLRDTALVGDIFNDNLYKPGISKFNEDGEHLWTMELGNSKNNVGFGLWESIIESQERDGYIVVGSDEYHTVSEDSIFAMAAIAKVNYDGDSLWMRRYSYDREGAFVQDIFNDVYPTSDGGYVCVGFSQGTDRNPKPGIYTILMKLDSEGRLDTSTVSTVVTVESPADITLFPNPTSGRLYIQQDGHKKYKVDLISSDGQIVSTFRLRDDNHTHILTATSFPSDGMYVLRFADQQGQVTVKKVMVSY